MKTGKFVRRSALGALAGAAILAMVSAGSVRASMYNPAIGEEDAAPVATPSLTASPATAGSQLNPASGIFALKYDALTGDVTINYNGFTGAAAHLFVPGVSTLSVIDITSANGAAMPLDDTKLTQFITNTLPTGAKTPPTHLVLNSAATPPVIPDGADLGRILPAGLDPVALAADLVLKINYTGSSSLNFTAGLTAAVPEPASLSLLGLGAIGCLARRRKV